MNRFYTPLLCLLIACPGGEPDDTGLDTPSYRDVDRDGYNERLDCDDYNAYVNPGEAEYCDGIDNNCDDLIDGTDSVDVITWYLDIDNDGYGDENAEPVISCYQPDDYICAIESGDDPCNDRCDNDYDGLTDDEDPDCSPASGDSEPTGEARAYDQNDDGETDFDCDDEDYMVNPGADERCADSRDNDCDNVPDSEETDASDGIDFYIDTDGDGYGNADEAVQVCQQPSGYVLDDTDCLDTDDTVYPEAAPLCDGQYNDCDHPTYEPDVAPETETDDDGDGYVVCSFPDETDPNTELCVLAEDYTECWNGSGTIPVGGDDCNDDPLEDEYAILINPDEEEVCDGLDNDCDGTLWHDDTGSNVEADDDGDGYVPCTLASTGWLDTSVTVTGGDDCFDDTTSDTLDLDGDGDLVESISSWVYPVEDSKGIMACKSDADADGFGASTWTFSIQSQPDDWVSGVDCDDWNAAVSPLATEICDGIDNDCDDFTDDLDPEGPDDPLTWYEDSDGDGYGNVDVTSLSCEPASGFVADDTDCQDSKPQQYPGAPEICNDDIINDCDWDSTTAPPTPCQMDLASSDTRIDGMDEEDHLGISISGIGDIDGDSIEDFLFSGWNSDGNQNGDREGAAWLVLGPLSSGQAVDLSADDAAILFPGNVNGDRFGYRVSDLGDLDNDVDHLHEIGITATLVGDHPEEERTENGGVYIFLGTTLKDAIDEGDDRLDTDDADIWIYGEANYDELGDGLANLGDLDPPDESTDPAYDDFAIGCTSWDDADSQEGGVFIFYGSSSIGDSGGEDGWDVTQAQMILSGDEQNDRIGDVFVGRHDLNGDGKNDLLIGASNSSEGATNSGTVYLGLGPVSDAINTSKNVSDLDASFYGRSVDDAAGSSLGIAGNLNNDTDSLTGDGYDDFYVGAMGDDTAGGDASGSVFLIYGSASIESTLDDEVLEDLYQAHFYGFENAGIGTSIDGSGDFDGDGVNDLLIGANSAALSEGGGYGKIDQGLTYLIYGQTSFSGSYDITTEAAAVFYGTNEYDQSGGPVRFVGDLYDNGTSAISIGSVNDSSIHIEAGAIYLIETIGM